MAHASSESHQIRMFTLRSLLRSSVETIALLTHASRVVLGGRMRAIDDGQFGSALVRLLLLDSFLDLRLWLNYLCIYL